MTRKSANNLSGQKIAYYKKIGLLLQCPDFAHTQNIQDVIIDVQWNALCGKIVVNQSKLVFRKNNTNVDRLKKENSRLADCYMEKPKKRRVSCKKRQTTKRIMTAPKVVGEIRLIMKTPPEEKMLEGV